MSSRLARKGMMVSDTTSEARMVKTTATGMLRMNCPGAPGRKSSGRKAKIRVAVQPSTADRRSAAWPGWRPRARVMALAQEAADVLHHHDRVVHQQPEGDDEADDAELVDGEARQVQQCHADRQRERDGDHHHQPRPAGPSGSSVSSTSTMAMAKSRVKPLSRWETLRDWSKPRSSRTPRGQLALEAVELLPQGLANLKDVLPLLHVGGDEDGALPVEASQVAGRPRSLHCHLGHVAQVDQAPLRVPATTVSATSSSELVVAAGLDVELPPADVDAAAGNVDVGALPIAPST